MSEIKKIVINKNRGWRGLAEVLCKNEENNNELKMIFSFSQPVWDDMLEGVMVLQTTDDYVIVHFDNTDELPKGQRSVLLKWFTANVIDTVRIPKMNWKDMTSGTSYQRYIHHFVKNNNNHTQSDWNCIGIRVVPTI